MTLSRRINDPGPMVVRLFHGTTRAAAELAQGEGLCLPNLDAEAYLVARRFGLDSQALQAKARSQSRYLTLEGRPGVYFASHEIVAARFAGRTGGEARVELLQCAFLLLNPDGDEATSHEWAVAQSRDDPAIVIVDAPYEDIRGSLFPILRATPMDRIPASADDYREQYGDVSHPNIRIPDPVPAEWIRAYAPIEPVLDAEALRDLGIGIRDLSERVTTGDFPPYDTPKGAWPGWWQSTITTWLEHQASRH